MTRRAALRRGAEAGLVLAATVVAALLFDGYFYGTGHRRYLLAAAGVGAVTGLVGGLAPAGRPPGRPGGRGAVAARVALGLLCVAGPTGLLLWVFRPGTAGPVEALRAGAEGVYRGWSRMVSVGLPAAPTPDLLALPVAAVWAAALGGVLLLRRPRARLVPMAPPVAAYLLALALTAPRTPARWLPAGVLLAAVALLVLVRPDVVSGGGRARGGTAGAGARQGPLPLPGAGSGLAVSALVAGLSAVLLVTGAGVAAVAALPPGLQRPPYDPRTAIRPAQDDVDVSNPLMRIKMQLSASPPAPLFSVAVDAPQLRNGLSRIRVAALDTYTGATWEPTGRFLRPGAHLPQDAAVNRAVPATVDVRVLGYTGTFLPVAGMLGEVDGDGLRVAAAQGNLITTAAGEPGLAYRLRAQVAAVDPAGVQRAVPDLSAGAAYTELPSPPAELVRYARSVTAGQPDEYARLKALESRLRGLPYGTAHPPGSSYAALVGVLGLRGTPPFPDSFAEQRASAFAVLARILGFPTRVVAGYVLSPAHRRADGTYQVMTDDAHAWPEVRLAGYGWVAFEPTPPDQIGPDRPRDGTPPQPEQQRPGRGQSIDADVNPQAGTAVSGGGGGGDDRSTPWWLLLLVAAVPLGVAVAKAVRRRRRAGAGGGRSRVLGAWAEARDRLLEAGLPRDPALTPPQVVQRARERFGADVAAALGGLGPLVDAAACGPSEPGPAEVEAAWNGHTRLRRALASAGSWPARLRRPFDPRPLLVRRPAGSAGRARGRPAGGPAGDGARAGVPWAGEYR